MDADMGDIPNTETLEEIEKEYKEAKKKQNPHNFCCFCGVEISGGEYQGISCFLCEPGKSDDEKIGNAWERELKIN